jgi:hypothetical protein
MQLLVLSRKYLLFLFLHSLYQWSRIYSLCSILVVTDLIQLYTKSAINNIDWRDALKRSMSQLGGRSSDPLVFTIVVLFDKRWPNIYLFSNILQHVHIFLRTTSMRIWDIYGNACYMLYFYAWEVSGYLDSEGLWRNANMRMRLAEDASSYVVAAMGWWLGQFFGQAYWNLVLEHHAGMQTPASIIYWDSRSSWFHFNNFVKNYSTSWFEILLISVKNVVVHK